MAQTHPPTRRYPALHHRNFTLIWSGLLVSNMGTWMQNTAQNWLIYRLTGNNALYLGYLGLSFALPMIIAPPIGGAVADRVDRIKLLYVTQTGSFLLAVTLAVLTWSGAVQPQHILLTTFLGALLLAFDNPTRQALIPELVPRQDLMNALALNSATYTGAALVGPAIAGVLLDVIGAGWLFMLNGVSFFAVLAALILMRNIPEQPRGSGSLTDALFGGFVYAWRHGIVSMLLLISAFAAVFGRSYHQLLPVFADSVWHAGSSGYGALLSAGGAGAVIGALVMSSVKELRQHGRALIASGLVFCTLLVAFVLTPLFWLGLVLLVLVSISATIFTTLIATVLQLRVPGQLRGRVMSLYAITLIGLPSLGSLGVAAVAQSLSGQTGEGWSTLGLRLLDVVGIVRLTSYLGTAAGAPRAVILGVLVLAVVLVATAPAFFRLVADSSSAPRA